MSKRPREDGAEEVRKAIELLCCRPAVAGETDGVSLTPLERQVVAMKSSLPRHVLLLVACGYRVKVYGRDSRTVSRRFGIMCIPGQPFEYSSVPYTRIDLYIHRLVAMGYHVAFADQESAAVRAVGGVRSGIFTRTIERCYSRGTLLPGECVVSNEAGAGGSAMGDKPTEAEEGDGDGEGEEVLEDCLGRAERASRAETSELFMCFISSVGTREVMVELVSFVTRRRDTQTFASPLELEDVLHRYDIVEVVIVGRDVKAEGSVSNANDESPLRLLDSEYAHTLDRTLTLHFGPTPTGEEDGRCVSVSSFRMGRTQTLGAAIEAYLKPYGLDVAYAQMLAHSSTASGVEQQEEPRRSEADGKTAETTLALPGVSLRALDIFMSGVGVHGSMLALLDRTVTSCGSRRLRAWLAAPAATLSTIVARQQCVTFLRNGQDAGAVESILQECSRVGDVEATLGKLHAQRCGVLEFTRLLRMVRSVSCLAIEAIETAASTQLPPLLQEVLRSAGAPHTRDFLLRHAAEVNLTATTPLEMYTTATSSGNGASAMKVPASLVEHIKARDAALEALQAELVAARATLHLPGLEYRTIAGTAFTLDIPAAKAAHAPREWTVISRTKANVRFHTPVVVRENIALCAARERMAVAASVAWQQRQAELAACVEDMVALTATISAVAILDVLRSFALVSAGPGYVAPKIIEFPNEEDVRSGACAPLEIQAGRHPVMDRLMHGQYVACDATVHVGSTWLLTGPNMGGKSAFMRMLGTFVVLAQLGCYVPARAATLPVFAGLYCRMGASDSILEGSSTFLTEMDETSRILRVPALSRSLVLMDELGRGTSSFDGVAVAAATLKYLTQHRVTGLFVTHYNTLCEPYAKKARAQDRAEVECYYMGFERLTAAAAEAEGRRAGVVFTYKICRGVTPSSFGVEVAKLAGLPERVTDVAARMSSEQQAVQERRAAVGTIAKFLRKG